LFAPRRSYVVPLPGGRSLRLGERALVMGILNVTPDSFAEAKPRVRSGELDIAEAVDAAVSMEAAGADLIDVGGESTRPGSEPVDAREELARVLPVVRAIAGRLGVPVSIDTYKADVARAALDAGAAIVNDVSGLRFDPALASVVADRHAALVVMHSRGRPRTMHAAPAYDDLIGDIGAELKYSLECATSAGVPPEQLLVDPGIGFAKQRDHSYCVLARLPELAALIDRPLVIGPSRKSFLKEASGHRPAAERDWATAAAVSAAVLLGAHIVRVHAPAEMVQVVRAAEEIRRHGEQAAHADR
jgi:dihydropteroate synthase